MGVLRIKDGLNEVLIRDPYDLFTVDAPQLQPRTIRMEKARAMMVGLVFATAVSAVVFWQMRQRTIERTDDPFAYFEIKAIGADGRPVTGASVRSGNEELGITDSFGEWRRFMRAHLGGTMVFQLTKKTDTGTLKALKNLAIPGQLPANGELEMKSRVLMRDAKVQTMVDTRTVVRDAAPHNAPTESAVKARDTEIDSSYVTEPASAPTVVSNAATNVAVTAAASAPMTSTPATAPVSGQAAGPGAVLIKADTNFNSVWVTTSGHATATTRLVAEAAKQRIRELGISLNAASPWQIRLTDLAVAGSTSHLLKIEGQLAGAHGPARIYSFLRNYEDAPMATARALLWESTVHISKPYVVEKKGDSWVVGQSPAKLWTVVPGQTLFDQSGRAFSVTGEAGGSMRLNVTEGTLCGGAAKCVVTSPGIERAPPHADWTKARLTVLGDLPNGATVYIGGYEVRKIDDGTYEYWNNPRVPGIVTVERDGKILHRLRLANQRSGLAVLSLPSAPLSRR
jgi:hypothetical protein